MTQQARPETDREEKKLGNQGQDSGMRRDEKSGQADRGQEKNTRGEQDTGSSREDKRGEIGEKEANYSSGRREHEVRTSGEHQASR